MKLRFRGSALLLAIGLFGAATPARSDCLTATVELYWWGSSPDTYPLGERDKCVTDTPLDQAQPFWVGDEFDGEEPVHPGTPKGVFVQVWVPVP